MKSLSLRTRTAKASADAPPIDAFRPKPEAQLSWSEIRELGVVASGHKQTERPPDSGLRIPSAATEVAPKTWLIPNRAAKPVIAAGLVAMLAPTFAMSASATEPPEQLYVQAQIPSADALAALVGRNIEVLLTNGIAVRGELIASAAEKILISQSPDGSLAEIQRADISSVRVLGAAAPSPYTLAPVSGFSTAVEPETRNRSTGVMVTGIVLTSIGAVSLLTYSVGAAASAASSYGYYGSYNSFASSMAPLALMGVVLLGAGIPMWIVGGKDIEIEPNVAFRGGDNGRVHGSLRFSF
ncbi:MAG: hypothetical protein ACJAYU_002948 [Bradymonadia bacterium]|jgi:hypothetical protein